MNVKFMYCVCFTSVNCNPFPTWYDVRPNQNGSFIYGMDVKYICRQDYAFVDGSEDSEKTNTCNSNGLWNEFIECEGWWHCLTHLIFEIAQFVICSYIFTTELWFGHFFMLSVAM